MSEIYTLLSKHFIQETSQEEEKIISDFKSTNAQEYEMLKRLWNSENLKIDNFDQEAAWQKLVKESSQTENNVIRLPIRKIASVAAVFLLACFFSWQYLYNSNPTSLQLVSQDTKKELILDDGSIVYLNKNSSISYPSQFDGNQRIVSLQGEAFFDITRDESKPFIIKTIQSEIEVLGTSFNIDASKERTEVAVKTGKVQVTGIQNQEKAILVKEQSAIITNQKLETFESDNENFLAWKTGKFVFKNQAISSIVNELNTFYENRIELVNQERDCELTASFDQATIEEILEIITLTCKLNTTKKNGTYKLK